MNVCFIRGWRAPIVRRSPLVGCWFITRLPPAYGLFRIGRVVGMIELGRWLIKEIYDDDDDNHPPELCIVSSEEILRDRDDESKNGRERWEFYGGRAAFRRRLGEIRAAEDRRRAKGNK